MIIFNLCGPFLSRLESLRSNFAFKSDRRLNNDQKPEEKKIKYLQSETNTDQFIDLCKEPMRSQMDHQCQEPLRLQQVGGQVDQLHFRCQVD